MKKKNILFGTIAVCLLLSACRVPANRTYTTDAIARTCGFEKERGRDFEMDGVSCVNLRASNSTTDERFNFMDFYIFDSVQDAKKAFEKTTDWYREIKEDGSDYRKGWLAGVCDADVESYEYLTGNMIITVETQVVSCWGENPETSSRSEPIVTSSSEDTEDSSEVDYWSQSYREDVVKFMRKTF